MSEKISLDSSVHDLEKNHALMPLPKKTRT